MLVLRFLGTSTGETTIDLEDRWFHPEWTKLKLEKRKVPLETRNLIAKGSKTSQGLVMLWLDIMSVAECQKYPPIDIQGPEKKKVEVRIICWRGRNIPLSDGTMVDAYCKFRMEGSDTVHKTDTHIREKAGKPAWNYRIKFFVELPLKNREYGRLKMECWDWDLFGDGELLGEATFDLYDWLLKAYHAPTGSSVKPFEEIRSAQDLWNQGNGGAVASENTTFMGQMLAMMGVGDKRQEEAIVIEHDDSGDGDEEFNENNTDSMEEGSQEGDEADLESNDEAAEPLLNKDGKTRAQIEDEEEGKPKKKAKPVVKELTAIEKIQELLGIGDNIAEDAEWMHLKRLDQDTKIWNPTGDIAISIELVTEEDANIRTVGYGRGTPNENPYLPYPPGRLQFMKLLDPVEFINEFCGFWGWVAIICICCIGLFAVFATILSGVMSFIQAVVMIQEQAKAQQEAAEKLKKHPPWENVSDVAGQYGVDIPDTHPPPG